MVALLTVRNVIASGIALTIVALSIIIGRVAIGIVIVIVGVSVPAAKREPNARAEPATSAPIAALPSPLRAAERSVGPYSAGNRPTSHPWSALHPLRHSAGAYTGACLHCAAATHCAAAAETTPITPHLDIFDGHR